MQSSFGASGVRVRALTPLNLLADCLLLLRGKTTLASVLAGYARAQDHLEVRFYNADGSLQRISRQANIRTAKGGDWMAALMGGTTGTAGYAGVATATTGTTLTSDTVTTVTTNQYAGCKLIAGSVYGVILSHTSGTTPVFTIDQWYALPLTGASGSTPGATTAYTVQPGQAPLCWIALSTDATAANNADTTLAAEVTTNSLGRTFAAFAHSAVSTASTTTQQTSTWTAAATFTAGSTPGSPITVQKAGFFNARTGGILALESLLNAPGVFGVAGDSAVLTWTITMA